MSKNSNLNGVSSHPLSSAQCPAEAGEMEMPPVDIIKTIQLIVDVANKKKEPTAAAKEFFDPYVPFAKVFIRDKAKKLIEERMSSLELNELFDHDFSEKIVSIAEKTRHSVRAYMKQEITREKLITDIGDSEIRDVTLQILSALGIHERLDAENMEELLKLAPATIAFTASMAAYQELKKALDDLAVAREQRIQIEKACQESVSMIRQYREEMNRIVSDYLTVRLETFTSGFDAMDQALIDGDVDGYIKGNVEIQEILGYKVQFASQDEFDALMDSDDAFKL